MRDRCLDGRRAAEMCAIVKQLDFDSRAGEREAAKAREKEARRAKAASARVDRERPRGREAKVCPR